MCGIIGVVSNKESNRLAELVVSCLNRLEYRGYDSVGVAALSSANLEVRKAKGTVEEVVRKKNIKELSGYAFLGHTRWATHGAPTDYNAHPHTDCSNNIAVIHNGTIRNFKELRDELQSLGHKFKSETDTEVIPHMMEEYIKRGMDTFQAFRSAVKSIQGSFAILAVVKGERRIFFAKRDNPLVIGLGDDKTFVASDIPSFLPYTRKVIVISDGELGYVTPNSVYIEDENDNPIDVTSRIKIIDWDASSASKEGYPHFMLKEIHESPIAVKDTISGLLSEIDKVSEIAEEIRESSRIIITAAGTSYHAGFYFSLLLSRKGYMSIPLIASEYHNFRAKKGDIVIAISQSGETLDVKMGIRKFKEEGAKIIALTNVIESDIARESDYKLYMRAGPEIGVAATKTFTSEIASLLFLYSLIEKESMSYLESAHETVRNVITETEGFAKKIGEELANKNNAYYLGRGLGVPLAMEGALKIKEIAYIHAEAYPAGESKHGPIALVENGFPIVFINDGELVDELEKNLQEMKARGGKTYSISVNKRLNFADTEILVNTDEKLSSLAIAPIIQLIAYYASVKRGYDPDKPRNLAKTVTVE
ncbi:glutamine--fructose-6-phosphate transaminase (isomerizing) [Saccharolobus shibatae]|uniref:Glutamine--fructose-6-phosphate aminotransferase [isomerizing] n=1 Tax=Saccharolobus shibatae TaxID=2286 RepID=A0A8F5H0M4_9CREN|nr:glutamine--fructose-6-phosphate transaminase (isomerizing) [Saccharolobus shibatae]QXJ33349.1 Glutamine--fructose-6-phosphate aminotransferase [isomerizing] [Saccharolobus shibatae]QXJ36464.1 Glutamine--fructose-6-phosphate aminotransferase [isomerizing] [Saccharolobus shibatae]